MALQEGSVSARLLIFSGRPDPEWVLDEAAIAELAARVARSVGGERSQTPPRGGLGYRGVLVRNRAGVPGLPVEFLVYRGVLSEQAGLQPRAWRDMAGIEALLLGEARKQGFGEVLNAVGMREAAAE